MLIKVVAYQPVGSMLGSFSAFLTLGRMYPWKNASLFIDPGFPVQKQQLKVIGTKIESFDVFIITGASCYMMSCNLTLNAGNIFSLLYSNPNNPSWICFTEDELKTIGLTRQCI